jgi:3-hydroxybutyrate dehydrogenase
MSGVIAERAKEMGRTAEEIEEMYVEGTALKRMVDPKHVAAAAVFLCSDESNSITGEAIDVSAGFGL